MYSWDIYYSIHIDEVHDVIKIAPDTNDIFNDPLFIPVVKRLQRFLSLSMISQHPVTLARSRNMCGCFRDVPGLSKLL